MTASLTGAPRLPHGSLGGRGACALVLAALAAFVAPRAARAQEPGLRGVVLTADSLPVAGANVTLAPAAGASQSMITADDGRFAFPGAAPGAAELRVRRIGFRAESLTVALPRADASLLAVRLAFLPQALAPVVVRGRPSDRRPPAIVDFYARQARGMGRFITRAEIERRNPMRTTDILRTVPGVAVYTSGGMATVRYRSAPCAPEVYLDGMPLSGQFDYDAIAPSTIEGIEVYSTSTVPAEFRRSFGRTSCGTVLLWSRYGEARPRRSKAKPVTSEDLARLVAELQLYTAQQVDSVARPPADLSQRVSLPDSVRVQGALGVIAEFVVDGGGRVEPATINIVASPHPALSEAVRNALPGATFTPAKRAGMPVRQLVQLALEFGSGAQGAER